MTPTRAHGGLEGLHARRTSTSALAQKLFFHECINRFEGAWHAHRFHLYSVEGKFTCDLPVIKKTQAVLDFWQRTAVINGYH